MKINERNLCVFATTPPYDLEGWLNKRGEVNKAWQKRYFVLKGNLLFYFEKKGDKEPLGLIIVEGCTIELSEDCEPYSFQIVFNGNRTYILSAETQNGMEVWMKSLTCAGYEYKKLMVAELRRQLDEIEEHIQEPIQPVAPKPPPRRQNPFNRPAPSPPVPNSSATIENLATIASNTAGSNTNLIKISNSNISGAYGKLQQPLPHRQQLQFQQHRQHSNNPNFLGYEDAEFSFRVLHETFAKHILKDIKERKRKKEPEIPLIIL